jgi:hypothetical protein
VEVDLAARRGRLDGVEVQLTRHEFEVLAYLARNAGKVMLHRQVLQAVWGGQCGDESDYVWTFVQRIRRKIEPDRAHSWYVLTETGVGYRMPKSEGAAARGCASMLVRPPSGGFEVLTGIVRPLHTRRRVALVSSRGVDYPWRPKRATMSSVLVRAGTRTAASAERPRALWRRAAHHIRMWLGARALTYGVTAREAFALAHRTLFGPSSCRARDERRQPPHLMPCT